ncbi:MAG: HPr kinase/phosphorylase, partial [Clostridia bacterium]|nr:HPr kinase/phosphorylase [Clostridia bacterium]
MKRNYTVSLARVAKECLLETIYTPQSEDEILIRTTDINRPGLAFSGYFEFFDPDRIQIIGNSEKSFLYNLPQELREKRLRDYVSYAPVAIIIARNLDIPELEVLCREYEVPLLRSANGTSEFTATLI